MARRVFLSSRLRCPIVAARSFATIHESMNSPKQLTSQYSLREVTDQVAPYTNVLTMAIGAFVTTGGVVYYDAQTRNKILVVDIEAKTQIELAKAHTEKVEIEAKAQIELVKAEAEKRVAEAEKRLAEAEQRVAEKFLMYGYAEEYARYQELAKIKKEEKKKHVDK